MSALTLEQRKAGASSYGMARRNPLTFFTYYCDYTLDVRQPAGEIVFRRNSSARAMSARSCWRT